MSDKSSSPQLSGTGIWEMALRYGDPARAADSAAEIEALGYTAVWIPDTGGDLFGAMANLLDSTRSLTWPAGSSTSGCRMPLKVPGATTNS